jgi:predicted aminopeptidase
MLLKNVKYSEGASFKDFAPYVAKLKAQSAGDVNRFYQRLKIMRQ